MAADLITAERLRALLHYDPETGAFTWRVTKSRVAIGDIAGSIGDGYINIKIDQKTYRAHRLAWFWMTGEWPTEIDHRDTDRANNCWSNLRLATRHQNRANARIRRDSRTGYKGVWRTPYGKFAAEIAVRGERKYLGVFSTPEMAHQAYAAEAQRSFGEFARSE